MQKFVKVIFLWFGPGSFSLPLESNRESMTIVAKSSFKWDLSNVSKVQPMINIYVLFQKFLFTKIVILVRQRLLCELIFR